MTEVKDLLYAKFDNILTRKGRGGSYPYIRWQDVADRMNEVFGHNWSSSVENEGVIGNNVVVRVKVIVTDPITNTTQWQEGYGGAVNDDRQEAGNPHKSAYSKALKDACKKWGVGLYMDEDGEQEFGASSSSPSGFSGKAQGVVPPAAAMSPNVSKPAASVQRTPEMGGNIPRIPSSTPGMQMPPNVGFSGTQTMRAPVNSFNPSTVPQNMGGYTDNTPLSKTPPINMGGTEYISDVQKAALNSILNIVGVDYTTLVSDALAANGIVKEQIPGVDELTYQEAVMVVKYGNDKFRKR